MEYRLRAPEFPIYTPVEQVLVNRGIPYDQINHYLNTTDNDILDPRLIPHLDEGAKMLIKHISQNDKVLIQIDSDCDGYTSAALLMNYLYCLFPSFVNNNISYRVHMGKQHGIIPDTIPEDVKLVIAPDSSSNDYEAHEYLNLSGVDVLVIDHHEADHISEYACIINNQLCDYPTKSLSGVAMVWKFCCYIDMLLKTDHAQKFLDLVALGLVADMMDVRDFETRRLIDKGLQQIRNPYFRGAIDKDQFHFTNEITPIGVAFYIAPLINATTRVGTQEEKLMLFESMLDFRGYELVPSTKRGCKGQAETRVEQACRNCTNIKSRQTKIRDNSLEKIEQIIANQNLLSNKILIVQLDDLITDRNLTGLIANQLMSEYQRPVLILNKIENEDGTITWEGSGRGYDKSRLKDFRGFLENNKYIMYAEGHANAFGIGIKDEDINAFIASTNSALDGFDFTPIYNVDFIYKSDELTPDEVIDIAGMKSLWGQGVEEAEIAVEGIKVHKDNIRILSPDKNPTLKIMLPNGINFMKFRSSEEEYNKLYSELGYVTINIVGECERNIWNNKISPQVMIKDYEIVDRANYYF